jgi:hypothetical protein
MTGASIDESGSGGDLRAWLDYAQDRHAQQPREVADGLRALAASLPDDADGADALRLAEHVLLAHLGDAGGLQDLLDALPPMPALQAARQRCDWVLATLHGRRIDDAPAPALRWRALQNLVLAWARQGRWQAASDALMAPQTLASTHPELDARKAYAATANNVALELRQAWPQWKGSDSEGQAGTLMIDAARLSRHAWAAAGTWLHIERAEYQLALCHATMGQGTAAIMHAQACLSLCQAEGADAVERFFGHEAMALAQWTAGDVAAAADARLAMQHLLAEIGDEAMQAWCRQAFQALEASQMTEASARVPAASAPGQP